MPPPPVSDRIPVYIEEPPDPRDTERPLVLDAELEVPRFAPSRAPLVVAGVLALGAVLGLHFLLTRAAEPERRTVASAPPAATTARIAPVESPRSTAAVAVTSAPPRVLDTPVPRRSFPVTRPVLRRHLEAEPAPSPPAEAELGERFTPSAAFEELPSKGYEFEPSEP